MSLSCSCDYDYDYEFEPGQWMYDWLNPKTINFEPLNTSKRKRCCSCNSLINIGDLCVKYTRGRCPYTEIEARIHKIDWESLGESTIPIASHFHCEKCGEVWLNLTAIGYECLMPNENMQEALKEYHELSGFKKEQKQ